MRTFIKWRALKRVNKIRAKLGMFPLKEMPVGTPRSVSYCPMANAIKNHDRVMVDRLTWGGGIKIGNWSTQPYTWVTRRQFRHSPMSFLFTLLFDQGIIT